MIALDTNVLVRLLVRDDPDQYERAVRLLEDAAESDERCYLSDAVLCETAWVLTSSYGASRADVLAAFAKVTADRRFVVDEPDAIEEALRAFQAGRAELADYLIGARAQRRDCRTTYTFDRRLAGTAGFTKLE